VIQLIVLSILLSPARGEAETKSLLFLKFDEVDQKLRWDGVAESTYPLALVLEKTSGSQRFVIGFSHLGYTVTDPDGRYATLTMAIKPSLVAAIDPAMNASETGIFVRSFVPRSIDLSLEGDAVEEKRLRSLLKLPSNVGSAATMPYQVRWKGVDGDSLYSWLTAANGLRWKLAGVLSVRLSSVETSRLNLSCLESWWSKRVGLSRTAEVEAPAFLIMTDIELAGCFETESLGRVSKMVNKEFRDQFIGKLLGAKTTFDAISKAGTSTKTLTQSDVEIPISLSFAPGRFLAENASYVKDLSGNSKGLEAIKKK
jgi:hypothetical protein